MVPGECPVADRATAIFVQGQRKSRAPQPAEAVGYRGRGGNAPARLSRARQRRGAMAQEKSERAAFARGKREAPRGGEIGERRVVRKLEDCGGERAAFERLFHHHSASDARAT